jgi:hypothetical protein
MPANYLQMGQTSTGSYDVKKKPAAPAAPVPVANSSMAANIKPVAPAPADSTIPRAIPVSSVEPNRSQLISDGKVATPESRLQAQAYSEPRSTKEAPPAPPTSAAPKSAPQVDYTKEFRKGTASNFDPKSPLDKAKMDALKAGDKNWANNDSARERIKGVKSPGAAPAPSAGAGAMAANVKPNSAEIEQNKTAMSNAPTGGNVSKVLPDVTIKGKDKNGNNIEVKRRQYETIEDSAGNKQRINPATGLPFGYQPGDKLPSGATGSMQTRAKESELRQEQSRPAAEAYAKNQAKAKADAAAAKAAPRPGSLEARDAGVAQAKANAQKEYEQRQAQGRANKAAWDAGDKALKDAGMKQVAAPASYDWMRNIGKGAEAPQESRSEKKALTRFYEDNPGIQSDNAKRWRTGEDVNSANRYDKMMEKRAPKKFKR